MATFPLYPNIVLDSVTNQTDSKTRTDLKITFSNELTLPNDGKPHYLKINNAKIPNTKYNISATLANNRIRYTMDNSDVDEGKWVWKDITFDDGIYTVSSIYSSINTALINAGDTELDGNGQVIYPFSITANSATSKAYVIINTNHSASATIEVDIGNGWTGAAAVPSTFYLLLGFTNLELRTNIGSSPNISTNNINIFDSEYYLVCPQIVSFSKAGGRTANYLYQGNFQGVANGYHFLTSDQNIVGVIKSRERIPDIELRMVDRNGALIQLGDNSTDSNLTFNLSIY